MIKQPTRKHLKMAISRPPLAPSPTPRTMYVTLDKFLLCFIDLCDRWGIAFACFVLACCSLEKSACNVDTF